jgi:uncharacterized protein (TIGR00369 family)
MPKRRYAASMEELPSLADTLSRSGLEFMQDIAKGKLAGPPIGQTLGFWPVEIAEGRVVFQGKPNFHYTNPLGTVHGGWYGAILDSCMACAVMTKVPKGSVYTTLEYKVNIIRPIPLDMPVHAIGVVQHAGRSTGIAIGEIIGIDNEKVYATGSTTCIIMNME